MGNQLKLWAIMLSLLLFSISSYAEGIDFSGITSGLGPPTFESSNPGLEAMQAMNQIKQQELQNQLLEERIAEEKAYIAQQQRLQEEQYEQQTQGNDDNYLYNSN